MSKIDPPTSTNDRPTNDSIRTRESLAATVILSLASTSLGLLGVYFLVYAGWTYLGSVEVFGRFPQAFKDAVRQEATSQFLFWCTADTGQYCLNPINREGGKKAQNMILSIP